MFKLIKKLRTWQLVLIGVLLFVLSCLAVGQAVTFAWLSNFPERAGQLRELQIKFWTYITLAAIFAITDLAIIVHLVKLAIKRLRP